MCLAPIQVPNPRRFYRKGLDQLYITVPCGKCRECVQSKQNDWFVRLYYEWQLYQKIGKVFFITFTYNDIDLPEIDLNSSEFDVLDKWFSDKLAYGVPGSPDSSSELAFSPDELKKISRYEEYWHEDFPFIRNRLSLHGFCKEHIKKYFKSLRQYVTKYNLNKSEFPIKYFVVCEYGKNFHRPHYHCLIFLPFVIDSIKFKLLSEKCWSYKVKGSDVPTYVSDFASSLSLNSEAVFSTLGTHYNDWRIYRDSLGRFHYFHSHGFCSYSKDSPAEVQSVSNLEYVCKYVGKFDSFLKNDDFRKLYDYSKVFPSLDQISHLKKLSKCVRKIREFFPFTLSSQGLGSGLLAQINLLDDSEKLDYLVKNEVSIKGVNMTYKIPQYIINRIFYGYIDSPCEDTSIRYVTETGLESIKLRYSKRIDELVNNFNEIDNVLVNFLSDVDKSAFENQFHMSVSAYFDVYKKHFGMFNSLSDLAFYDICFRDVLIPFDDADKDIQFYRDLANDFFDYKIDTSNIMQSDKLVINRYLRSQCFNSLPCFRGFDKFLECHRFLRKCVLTRDSDFRSDKDHKISLVREALNRYYYSH